ncbi:MAG: TonB-dependent receptor [Gemmatimonadales bacterium]|nr:TonB-dependent receptor [Gemmatimonadales bacterium]
MRFLRLILAALILSAPAVLSAQATQDSTRVDSTRVARQYDIKGLTISVPRPALTTGGSSAVEMRLDSLRSVPAPTMEDVVRAMPLLVIRQNSRGESHPSIRGSEERQIGIFLDGVPLTVGWDHRTDLSIIPLTAAQGIRLIRGLSSVLYGPNTLGGVIEVDVARVPGRIESVNPMDVGISVNESGGTNIAVGAAHLIDRDEAQWLFRAGAGFSDRPGYTVPNGASDGADIRPQFLRNADGLRLNSDTRRMDAYFAARVRGEDGGWASLATTAYDVERGVPPEAHQDEPRFWRYPEQTRLLTALSFGTGSRYTGSGRGDVEVSLGMDLGSTRIDQYDTGAFQSVVEREDSDDRNLSFRLEGEHTLGDQGDFRASATYADVNHDEVLTPGGSSEFRQRLWSLGAETEWKLGPTDGTRLSLGAVLDGADTPESGDKPPLARLNDFGARIGISSLLSGGLLVHGGASRRARFPSLRELYSGALGRFIPNPSLEAEIMLGAEGGFTVHTGDLEIQVVGFHQRLADGIIRTTVTDDSGTRLFKRVNQDQIQSTGIEMLAIGTLGVATISTDLTLQHVRGVEPDGTRIELEYEPSVTGEFSLESPLGGGYRAASDFRFVSDQRCANPEIGGLQSFGASGSADFSLRKIFQFGGRGALSRVDASASVRNATNSTSYDQCGLPQPGRTLQVQFRVW